MKHVIETQRRFVLLHFHLLKNAGSTFAAALAQNFGEQLAYVEGSSGNAALDGAAIVRFLREHPQVRAISSHHLRYPLPQTEDFAFFDVMILRDPIDRLRSIYDFFCRSSDDHGAVGEEARKSTLAEFLAFLVDHHPNWTHNVQVNLLANGRYTRPVQEFDLEAAKDRVRRCSVPAEVEEFDLSAVAAEYFLRPVFGELNLSVPAQNVAPRREATLQERLDEIRRSCGEALYDQLLQFCRFDLQLVQFARDEVHRRCEEVPNHDSRLTAFRQRRSKTG